MPRQLVDLHQEQKSKFKQGRALPLSGSQADEPHSTLVAANLYFRRRRRRLHIHHDHPAVAEPPSVKNARMLVLRTWPNDVSNFVASANTMIIDEGQQEGHPEVVAVLAMANTC